MKVSPTAPQTLGCLVATNHDRPRIKWLQSCVRTCAAVVCVRVLQCACARVLHRVCVCAHAAVVCVCACATVVCVCACAAICVCACAWAAVATPRTARHPKSLICVWQSRAYLADRSQPQW